MEPKLAPNVTPGGHYTGWRVSPPDPRDHRFAANLRQIGEFPPHFSLLAEMPPRLAQGMQDCTANSASYVYDHELRDSGRPFLHLSRLFQYAATRLLDGTPLHADVGATIRSTMKAMADFGAIPETMWPYILSRFSDWPSQHIVADGLTRQVLEYKRVQQLKSEIMGAVYTRHPVIHGMLIYSQYENVGGDGMMRMPNFQQDRPLSGHSSVITGWTTLASGMVYWEHCGTWGTSFARNGTLYLPEPYLLNPDVAADFWLMERIEGEVPPVPPPPPPGPDPWAEYGVGPGIEARMRALGDVPASPEREMVDQFMRGTGVREATGASGVIYRWIVSQERCVVFRPDVT